MLPSTYTLSPFLQKRSAISARFEPLLFHSTIRCHSVFSSFSPDFPFQRRLVAIEMLATRPPLAIERTSGSAPRLPIRVTLFRLRLMESSREEK